MPLPRPIICDDFPGRVFTLAEVAAMTGRKFPSKSVIRQNRIGRHVFRYRDDPIRTKRKFFRGDGPQPRKPKTAVTKPVADGGGAAIAAAPLPAITQTSKPALTKEDAAARDAWGKAQNKDIAERRRVAAGIAKEDKDNPRVLASSLHYQSQRGKRLGELVEEDCMPINGARLPARDDTPTLARVV